ncbi:MAG: iron-sulfur cluster assembly scaffold protein [Thermoplasmatales archaeon]
MYNDEVMDRYENPIKSGKIENFDIKIDEASSTCGDRIILYIKLDKDRISDMRWEGDGCILSIVSTDMFCENSIGKELKDVAAQDEMTYVNDFPVKITAGRLNCVLLPLRAFKRSIKEK